MTDLTKYEIVKMARDAGAVFDPQWGIASNTGTATFERFATLCRAPLVAEVERLEQWHAEMADNRNAIASERDTLKAELARVRAGKPVAYIAWKNDKPCYEGDDAICEDAVWPVDSDDYRTSMPVFTAPQPAAQEPDCATTGVCVRSGLYASPPSAVPVVEQLVEALREIEWSNDTKWQADRASAAIAAGQQYLKENGK